MNSNVKNDTSTVHPYSHSYPYHQHYTYQQCHNSMASPSPQSSSAMSPPSTMNTPSSFSSMKYSSTNIHMNSDSNRKRSRLSLSRNRKLRLREEKLKLNQDIGKNIAQSQLNQSGEEIGYNGRRMEEKQDSFNRDDKVTNISIDSKINGITKTKMSRFDNENEYNSNGDINTKADKHSFKSTITSHSNRNNNSDRSSSLNNEDDIEKSTNSNYSFQSVPVASSPKSKLNSYSECEYGSGSSSTLSPPPPSMSPLMLIDSNEQQDDDELRTPTAASTTSNTTLDNNTGNNTCKRNIFDNFKNDSYDAIQNEHSQNKHNVTEFGRKGYNEITFQLNVESSSSSSSDDEDDRDEDENDLLTPVFTKRASQEESLSHPYQKYQSNERRSSPFPYFETDTASPTTTTMKSNSNNNNSSSEQGMKISASNHTETLTSRNYDHDYHYSKDDTNGESSSDDEDLQKLRQKYRLNRQKFQLNDDDDDDDDDAIEDNHDGWETTKHSNTDYKGKQPYTKNATSSSSTYTAASTSKITTLQGLRNQPSYASFSILERKGLSSSISPSRTKRKRQQRLQQQQLHSLQSTGTTLDANKGNNTGTSTKSTAKGMGRNINIFSSMEDIIDCSSSDDDKMDTYGSSYGIAARQKQVVAQKHTGQNYNNTDVHEGEEEEYSSEDNEDDDTEGDLIVLPKRHCQNKNDKTIMSSKHFQNQHKKISTIQPNREDIICIDLDSDTQEEDFDLNYIDSRSSNRQRQTCNNRATNLKSSLSSLQKMREKQESENHRFLTYPSSSLPSSKTRSSVTKSSSRSTHSASIFSNCGHRNSTSLFPSSSLLDRSTVEDMKKARNDLNGGSGTGLNGVFLQDESRDGNLSNDNDEDVPPTKKRRSTSTTKKSKAKKRKASSATTSKSKAKSRKKKTQSGSKKTTTSTRRRSGRSSYGRGRGRGRGRGGWARKNIVNNKIDASDTNQSAWSARERGFRPYQQSNGNGGAWTNSSSGQQSYMNVATIDPQLGNLGGASIVYE